FTKFGGSIAEPGSVAWQFDRKGVVEVAGPLDEDQLVETVLESGAENFTEEGGNYLVTTQPHDLAAVRDALEAAGLTVVSSELTLVPQNVLAVTDDAEAKRVLRLVDAMDEHDDVQNVFANFDVDDEVLAAFEA
ncbi:MAG: YebC/PmpR family DNA-binding transcriptional regulator, partial [Acidobacteriota bacterium]|nr:YebC/PmpR family DNA-binding transcriptional regulator [Acidobacteriota bacterium]